MLIAETSDYSESRHSAVVKYSGIESLKIKIPKQRIRYLNAVYNKNTFINKYLQSESVVEGDFTEATVDSL